MPRRSYKHRFVCAEPDCREKRDREFETRDEEAKALKYQQEAPWKCIKHSEPEKYLQPGNEETAYTFISSRIRCQKLAGRREWVETDEWEPGLYWLREGWPYRSSQVSGPGFVAETSEFPEGTRLMVTARILPPETESGDD